MKKGLHVSEKKHLGKMPSKIVLAGSKGDNLTSNFTYI